MRVSPPNFGRGIFMYLNPMEDITVNIPLNVDVYCTNGLAGQSITTISNPNTNYVTHIVVAERQSPYVKRLVSVKFIKETTPQVIYLNCTHKEFSKMEQLERILAHPTEGYITHLVLKPA